VLASDGALTRLLAAERELEALVAESRVRAQALINGAEARAQAHLSALDTELAGAAALVAARLRDESRVRLDEMKRETAEKVARLAQLDDAAIGHLAEWVVEQVLRADGGRPNGGRGL
jgi:hypothetical protein